MDWKAYLITTAAAVVATTAPALPEPARKTYHVKVEGSSFRVTVKGDTVIVANKAMITGRTLEVRAKMRLAVKAATGCQITDDLWFDAVLKGALACD